MCVFLRWIHRLNAVFTPSGDFRRLVEAPAALRAMRPLFLRGDVLGASLAFNITSLALPVALLQVYDRIIPQAAFSTLSLLAAGVATALVLDAVLRELRAHIASFEGARVEHGLGTAFIAKVLAAPAHAVERTPIGEHLDRMAAIEPLRDFETTQAGLAVADIPFLIVFLGLLAYLGGVLVFLPLGLILVFGVIAWRLGSGLHTALLARSQLDDRRYNFIIETLSGLHTIKALALEAQMARRYERLMDATAGAGRQVNALSDLTHALGNGFAGVTTAVVAGIGSLFVINGQMSVGGLAASTLLAGRIVQPALRGLVIWTRLQSIRLARQRLAAIAALPAERPQTAPAAPPLETLAALSVSFGYARETAPLFEDLSLEVRRGEIVGITGTNGVGKSTLLWLIMGGLDPFTGAVQVNGLPITRFSAASVREQIAYVPQQAQLLQGSVLDNLTRFRPDLHLDDALALAARLGLDKVFAALPEGYDTPIGESGVHALPAGVVQRIAIVRALVGRPRFVLFDEANAALDAQSDAALRDLLTEARESCGIVLVSFRPSLLAVCDRSFALAGRRLVPLEAGA